MCPYPMPTLRTAAAAAAALFTWAPAAAAASRLSVKGCTRTPSAVVQWGMLAWGIPSDCSRMSGLREMGCAYSHSALTCAETASGSMIQVRVELRI